MKLNTSNQWYKDAIIYELDVEAFLDGNGDGVGDFQGLIKRLDYLAALGVTCVWLLPFYPSPYQDNGYDVSDYYNVAPRNGSLGDFVEFIHEAERRGIAVMVDLVVNHTSDQHPWFQHARHHAESPWRNFYVWRDEKPEHVQAKQVVYQKGESRSPWTWDDTAKAYYWHRFYDFEPDLNTPDPEVQREIARIMGFWLRLGVSGFRIDAAPYLGGKPTPGKSDGPGTHEVLRAMHDFVTARSGTGMLLAETDVAPQEYADYFGDGGEVHMLFNFYLTNFLFLALARERAEPIVRAYDALPEPPLAGQWANFLRNHDELDLEQLSKEEREEVMRIFAPDEDMRIYGRGIRRRYPPMVGGDRRRMELAYSLLLSLPGTPILRYGEEIGMGDDLSLSGRNSVRTPMQWSSGRNAGFSTANPESLVRPIISGGPFGYEQVNVADQQRDPDSFLNWMARAIRARRQSPEFGWGTLRILPTDSEAVLAHACEWEARAVIALHNLSRNGCRVSVDFEDVPAEPLVEMLSDADYDQAHHDGNHFDLEPYGYRWFQSGGFL